MMETTIHSINFASPSLMCCILKAWPKIDFLTCYISL